MRIARSTKNASTLLAFAGWFFVASVALFAVWGYITPIYNQMVASIASPIFKIVERDNVTALRTDGNRLLVGRHAADGTIQPFLYFDPYIYFGLIPLIALLVAIPGPGILRRLRRTLIGIVILFVVHVIYLIGSIELTYVAVGLQTVSSTGKRMLDWVQILLRILWQVSPVLIAVLLGASYWRDHLLSFRRKAGKADAPTQCRLISTEGVEGERP